MKVVYVIDALGEGGTEMSLAELLIPLAVAGIEATVVCLKSRGDEGVELGLRTRGIDIRVVSSHRLSGQVRDVARILREQRPDLVHTMLFRANLVGRLAGRREHVPVVSSLVNMSYSDSRLADPRISKARMRVTRSIDGFTARHFTKGLHAVSAPVKEHAVAALRVEPDRITVVERGRDPARLGTPSAQRRADARRMLGLTADDEVVVNVGRREYQKGHRDLLDAVALLRDRPRLVVLVAGRDGNTSQELDEQIERLGIERAVRFLGHRADVPEILAAADVFVLPSLYEGLPGAVIEAMALGLPIVASDIPSVREVVTDDSALLTPPGHAVLLAEALRTLLDDPVLRERMGARSRARYLQHFTIDRSVDGMRRFYTSVLEDS